MAKAQADIVAAIVEAMPESNRSRPWWQKVAAQHRPTLDQIKEAWRAGTFGTAKSRAADAIANILGKHGIASIGRQGVVTWLEQ
jgi:hypothetical protein